MPTNDTLHIYTRVSTDAQEEKGTSLDSQKALGIEAAKKLKLKHKVWNEGGASSYYEDFTNRPVLLELLRRIEAGEVSHLWVYNNDRLSRNDITAQTIRVALQKYNVILYTKDGIFNLNNPQDKLMKTILDGMAAFDNAMRADRTRLGKVNRVKQGFWMGGPPPFGYEVIDKKLALHPVESTWVQKIYRWYADGKTVQWIQSELNKNGITTNRGNANWSQGSIHKILQNTHPIGIYTYTDAKTDETIECLCPSIISTSLWNACQEKRKKILERKGQNNRTQRFYLLRNLMYCGHCGSAMSARTKESKNEYLYYCPRKEKNWKIAAPTPDQKWVRNRGCDMTKSLNIHRTDKFVWGNVIVDLFKSNYLQKNIEKMLKATSEENPETAIKKAQGTLARLKKEKAKLIDDIASVETAKILGTQDKSIADKVLQNLRTVLRENEAKIEQIDLQLLEIQRKSTVYKDTMRNVNMRGTGLIDPDNVLDLKQRKVQLERLIEKIVVFYDKDKNEHELKFHFKIPLLQEYEQAKGNAGRKTLKKTLRNKALVTPQVDNLITVE